MAAALHAGGVGDSNAMAQKKTIQNGEAGLSLTNVSEIRNHNEEKSCYNRNSEGGGTRTRIGELRGRATRAWAGIKRESKCTARLETTRSLITRKKNTQKVRSMKQSREEE